MKKMLLLAMAMFLVGLFLGPVALAQVLGGGNGGPPTTAITYPGLTAGTIPGLAPSGGPSMLLPAAALLLGTGVLTYTILTRRT
jgi:hypothetical protein